MALSFSGTGQYLSRASAISTVLPVTFACWFKTTNAVTNQRLMILASATADLLILDISGGNVRAIEVGTSTSGPGSSNTYTTNTFYHAVAVFASATSRTVYLNGVAVADATNCGTLATPTQTLIGATKGGGTLLLNGVMAFPAIWNIALSAGDVASLYNSGLGADPQKTQTANVQSFLKLAAAVSPQPDTITTSWTVNGSPTFAADPFSLTPAAPVALFVPLWSLDTSMGLISTNALSEQYQIQK